MLDPRIFDDTQETLSPPPWLAVLLIAIALAFIGLFAWIFLGAY